MEITLTKQKPQFVFEDNINSDETYFKISELSTPYNGTIFLCFKEEGKRERFIDILNLTPMSFIFDKGMNLEKIYIHGNFYPRKESKEDWGRILIEKHNIKNDVPTNIVTVSSFDIHYPIWKELIY